MALASNRTAPAAANGALTMRYSIGQLTLDGASGVAAVEAIAPATGKQILVFNLCVSETTTGTVTFLSGNATGAAHELYKFAAISTENLPFCDGSSKGLFVCDSGEGLYLQQDSGTDDNITISFTWAYAKAD